MNIIELSTGVKKTAVYATTAAGHKRLNVDGTFYSDKQFNKLFTIVNDGKIILPLFGLVKKMKKSPDVIAKTLMNTIFSTYDCSYSKGMLIVVIS